jgi:LacI family transcriptional regulator/LacI family repressor for deo operon, udp, cdd, tsx, nupC, and nupG
LAYLAGPNGYSNDVRLRGFRAACARLGIEATELGPFHVRYTEGIRAADLALATPATGLIAFNDEIAVGVLNRLADRGVRVPEQLSVVGFDDTGLAEMVSPRLTTVRVPAAAAGVAAVDMLLAVVAGRDVGPGRVELFGQLIVRASTGPAATEGGPSR